MSEESLIEKRKLAARTAKLLSLKKRKLYEHNFFEFFKEAWKQSIDMGVPFADSWHYRYLCEYLTIIGAGKFHEYFPGKKGIIINVPPRTSKSNMLSIAFPVWKWINDPTARIMAISYGADLAIPLSLKRRDLIKSDWFRSNWGDKVRIKDDSDQKVRFDSTAGGYMIAGTPGGTITGIGGNLILIDDPLKASETNSKAAREGVNNFWDDALDSRLNDPSKDLYMVIMQRLHSKDLSGYLMDKEKDWWINVSIPMEAERDTEFIGPLSGKSYPFLKGELLGGKRFPAHTVASWRSKTRFWRSQMQQDPTRATGYIFNPDGWRYYDPTSMPDPPFQVMSVDCAYKSGKDNDQNAIHIYGAEGVNRWLLYRDTRIMNYTSLLDAIREAKKMFPKIAYILVEEAANGFAVIKQLRSEFPGVVGIKPEGSKESRAHSASADVESGNVFLPMNERVGWTQKFVDNFSDFAGDGSVEYDDDIDAMSQAVNWLRARYNGVMGYYDTLAKEDAPVATVVAMMANVARLDTPLSSTCSSCKRTVAVVNGSWQCDWCGCSGKYVPESPKGFPTR